MKKRRVFSLLLALVMVLGLLPTAAFAASITYLDEDGKAKTCSNPTQVTSASDHVTWAEGWYYVEGEVTISERVAVSGAVHLILKDGSKLTTENGIGVVTQNDSLTIYAQSTGADKGELTAWSGGNAGIGGNGGNMYVPGTGGAVTINGGRITASGKFGAGIGGGQCGDGTSNVTINGGEITAFATYGAGIGGGQSGSSGGTVTINGGTVTASSESGAGIGGGHPSRKSGTITINGGTVTATGGAYAAGIGGGEPLAGESGEGEKITITGGTVTATGGTFSAGIGGGRNSAGGEIVITGGVVRAVGYTCGIGNNGGDGGSTTISGGVVTAGRGGINSDSFSTGGNGAAIIVASSINDNDDTSGWSGLIITQTTDEGKFYGKKSSYTVDVDLEIPSDYALTIGEGQSLTVSSGATLTNRGTIVNNGTFTNNGTICNYGTISGNLLINNGILHEAPVLALSFESGGQTVTNATYDQSLTLKVTVTGRSDGATVNTGTVNFYKDYSKEPLNAEPVSVSKGVAEYTMKPTGSDWKPSPYPWDAKTIKAEYTSSSSNDLLDTETSAQLQIDKGTRTAVPDAPTLFSRTASEVVLVEQTAPTELNSSVEYGYAEGDDQPSSWSYYWGFGSLESNTAYTFYARYKENEYYNASSASAGTVIYTLREEPDAGVVTINYEEETISFDDTLEVNPAESFDGTALSSGQSITNYIGSSIYVRLPAAGTLPPSEVANVAIPSRPNNGAWVWTRNRSVNSITISTSSAYEYRMGEDGAWRSSADRSLTFENLTADTTYTIYTRRKATDSSFVSAVGSGSASTLSASGPYSVGWEESITVNGVTVTNDWNTITISGPNWTTTISNYRLNFGENVIVDSDGQISVPGGAKITASDGSETTVPEEGGMVSIATGEFTKNVHIHCVCGGENSVGDHETHTDIEWKAWGKTDSLPTEAGSYYLTQNVTLGTVWECSGDVNLCLNGHTITGASGAAVIDNKGNLTITDCQTTGTITHAAGVNGHGIQSSAGTLNLYGGAISGNTRAWDGAGLNLSGGTFNMYGGVISNNKSTENNGGGGVYVGNGAIFNLYGGSITDNSTTLSGGGVFVDRADDGLSCGTFNMTGGSITGNSAGNNGGGVCSKGTFTLSGTANITDNFKDSTTDNVYLLNNAAITVNGSMDAAASVGITGTDGQTVVTGTTARTGFFSDEGYFLVDNSKNGLKLSAAHTHCVCGSSVTVGGHSHDTNVVWTAWDGTSDIEYTNSVAYVCLTRSAERTTTLAVANGKTLYLCLNGNTLTLSGTSGDATIGNNGTLVITDCTTNSADVGRITHAGGAPGKGVVNSGTFTLWNGIITGNTSNNGAGVYNNGGATFDMCGGSITGNTAEAEGGTGGFGGGVYNNGTFNMSSGTITRNTAYGGGGVYSGSDYYNAAFTMTGGSITDNSATTNGGGVYNDGSKGTFTVFGAPNISGNKQGTLGKDNNVYLDSGKTITVAAGGMATGARVGITGALGQIVVTGTTNTTGFTSDNEELDVARYGTASKLKLTTKSVTISEVTLATSAGGTKMTDGKTYDGVAVAFTEGKYEPATVTGVTLNYTWQVKSGNTYQDLSAAPSDAGSYRLHVTATKNGNTHGMADYDFTISQKELTVNVVVKEKTYNNDDAATVTVTLSGGLENDKVSLDETGMSAKFSTPDAGDNKTVTVTGLRLSGDDAGNYKLPTTITGTGKITKAAGTGTVTMDGWTYGETAKTPTTNSTTNPGNVSVVYKDANGGTVETPSKAGNYTATVTFPANDNYNAVEKTVNFTIEPRLLTASLTVQGKIYDGGTTVPDISASVPASDIGTDTVSVKVVNASFGDKDVGTQSVTATVELDGADKANYRLASATATATATITAKTLTIENLAVADKLYDGTNTASISGTPTLIGLADCDKDKVELNVGTPTFASVNAGANIPVSFSDFSITGDAAKNYNLTQPTGSVSANINAYTASGKEYTVSTTSEWTNQDFTVTAKEGWQLSTANTANGSWVKSLTCTEETDSGSLIFYVKNATTGVISTVITKTYKIDKTAPAITGAKDGETCFEAVTLRVTDSNLDAVTINGETVELESDGTLTLNPAADKQTVIATDKAGNRTTVAVTVHALVPRSTWSVTVEDSANGTVVADRKSASKGSTVTLTVKPDAGYLLKTLVVFDEDGKEMVLTDKGDGKYTFTMPGGKVTVSAVFANDYGYERGYASCTKDATCLIETYADAVNTAWYHDGVHFCIDNGLMQGVSSTSFQPAGDVTRAQVVTILWRLEGKPVVDYAMQFEDAASGEWFTEAVRWAASNGIVEGYNDKAFGPNDAITREQFAAILYRYSQFKGYDVSVGEDTNILDFDDAQSISTYAVPAIQWACGSGMISGVSALTLDPQGITSRAQAATMFMRYCENVNE